jgi:hypothetical protein
MSAIGYASLVERATCPASEQAGMVGVLHTIRAQPPRPSAEIFRANLVCLGTGSNPGR